MEKSHIYFPEQKAHHTRRWRKVKGQVLYLGRSIGIDGDHVLNSLFDFELDVELSLQGSDAFLVG